jgi:hypothetical protein
MSHFALRQNPTQVLSRVTTRIGEESEKLVLVAEPADSGVRLAILIYNSGSISLQEVPDEHLDQQRNLVFTVVGRKSGTSRLEAREITTRDLSGTKLWGSLEIVIQDAEENDVDLFYFGKYLVWRRSLPPFSASSPPMIFAATSGNSPWVAGLQGMSDSGPIPEGLYSLLATIDPLQASSEMANHLSGKDILNDHEGIQFLATKDDGQPRNDQWGTMRVKLTTIRFQSNWFVPSGPFGRSKTGFNRFGFYLHNSHKGFSHGCVEVGMNSNNQSFFDALLSYAISDNAKTKPRLRLKVSYRDRNTETKGGTEF